MPVTLIQNANDINLNTHNEVDQILGRPPGWILKWGISLVFLTVMIFLMLAWFIKFPDTVPINVTILTENPAIRLVPKVDGRIESLLVDDQQYIEQGTKVAILESPVDQQSISELESWLNELNGEAGTQNYQHTVDFPVLTLGNLDSQYAALIQKVQDYQYYLVHKLKSTSRKIEVLEEQISSYQNINLATRKEYATLNDEADIARRNYQRNQQLNKEGVISDINLEEIEKARLQYKRQLENLETQMISNKIQIEQLQIQIIDLKQSQTEEQKMKELSIQENIQSLKAQINLWKQTYQIIAPISGKVSLSTIWSPNQYVRQGEEVMTIVPINSAGNIVARAKLPTANSGKVKVGQTVNIKLNGFPYQEFGIIKATVAQISLVPEGSAYNLDLSLSNALVTTYDKEISFQQEMEGTGDIITEDRRIIHRIFDRIWNLIKNI